MKVQVLQREPFVLVIVHAATLRVTPFFENLLIMEHLYNLAIGFPKDLITWRGIFHLQYSKHALEKGLTLPKVIDFSRWTLIEVTVENNKMVKGVYRKSFNSTQDICMVIIRKNFVKTVWLNHLQDNHKTLDKSRYGDVKC